MNSRGIPSDFIADLWGILGIYPIDPNLLMLNSWFWIKTLELAPPFVLLRGLRAKFGDQSHSAYQYGVNNDWCW